MVELTVSLEGLYVNMIGSLFASSRPALFVWKHSIRLIKIIIISSDRSSLIGKPSNKRTVFLFGYC